MAIKRGKGQRLIPLEEIRERERVDVERSDRLTCRPNLRTPLGVYGSGASAGAAGRRISQRGQSAVL